MQEIIKVHVVKYKTRPNLVMRYVDPTTGRQVTRSAKTANRRMAEREAAKWESELREGRYMKPQRMTWDEFRERFCSDVLEGLKATTALAYSATFNVFERKCNPQNLADVTTTRLTGFVTLLRKDELSPATIARHLRTLRVAMRWAHRQGILVKVPTFDMPKQAKGMRGRPITLEEFERMLAAVPKVMGETASASWKFYLRGLSASGLRLTESLSLRWDEAPGAIVVDLGGRRPMMRIPAESEKGNTHRTLPMAPEFARLLAEVAPEDRAGWVFRPLDKQGSPLPRTRHAVGPRVGMIGEGAGVVVDQRDGLNGKGEAITVNAFAGAHDLRRAFGFRWSRLVMPPVLKELMRHQSIETTMRYYVGVNAEATADELWRVVGSIPGSAATAGDSTPSAEIAASR